MRIPRAIPVLVLAWLLAVAARADDGAGTLLVLGPAGRPLDRVLVTRAEERFEGRPLLAPESVGREVALDRGLLAPPEEAADGTADVILWRPDLGASAWPSEPSVVGLRLPAAAELSGRVRYATGAPAAKRDVVASPVLRGGVAHRAETDADGRFSIPSVAPGSWRVWLLRGDGRWQGLGTFTTGGDVSATLGSGGHVQVQLLDAAASGGPGWPGRRVTLSLLPGGSAPPGEGPTRTTDDRGFLEADDLPAGVWEARPAEPDWFFDPAPERFEVEAGRDVELHAWYGIRTTSVSGRVMGPDERPVAGARVRALVAASQPLPPDGAPPEPVGKTDAEGRFTLAPVRPDLAWRVEVKADGYASAVTPPFDVLRGHATDVPPIQLARGWTLEVEAHVSSGKPARGVQVTAIPVSRPSDRVLGRAPKGVTDAEGRLSLVDLPPFDVKVVAGGGDWASVEDLVVWPRSGSGTVWRPEMRPAPTLDGTVVFEGGKPARGWVVEAHARGAKGQATARTDDAGAFRLVGLPAVPTDLSLWDPGARTPVPSPAYAGAVPGETEALSIVVPPRRHVHGRAEDLALGLPAAHVTLEAALPDPEDGSWHWEVVDDRPLPTSEPNPSFAFDDLPPGPYAVRLVRGLVDSGPVPARVDESDVDGLVLTLPAAGGRVVGTVLYPTGAPYLGAGVRLVRLRAKGDAAGGPDGEVEVTTGAEGGFAFDEIAPGGWRVEVRARDRATWTSFVRVGEGETIVVPDVVLGGGATLDGRVVAKTGAGLDGARVVLEPVDEGPDAREATTDAEGRFTIEHVSAGPWRATLEGFDVVRDVTALVDVPAEGTVHLDLQPDGRGEVGGHVTRDGRAVPDARVGLVSVPAHADETPFQLEVATDGSGAFAFDELPEGAYEVEVLDGVVRRRHPVFVREMDRLSLDLEVWGGRVRGRVVLPSGRGVSGATVVASPRGGTGEVAGARGVTDPEGAFLIPGLPVGPYELTAYAPGLGPGPVVAAVAREAGAEQDVEIVLGAGGVLVALVTDTDGRPVGGARVWIEDEVGRALNAVAYATPPTGRLEIRGVPTGPHRLRVEAAGFGRPPPALVRVVEGQTTTAQIRLPMAGALRLVVRGTGRDPLPRARVDVVRAVSGEPVERRARLEPVRLSAFGGRLPSTGALVVDDLAPGAYLVRVDAGPSYAPLEAEVVIEGGRTTDVQATLSPTAGR